MPKRRALDRLNLTFELQPIRCGKPRCRCNTSDQRMWHGPYWYGYYLDKRGKQKSIYLGRPDRFEPPMRERKIHATAVAQLPKPEHVPKRPTRPSSHARPASTTPARPSAAQPRASSTARVAATLNRDRMTGRTWLHFAGRPEPEVIAALKREGWRWSGYRKAWNTNKRFARPPAGIAYDEGPEVDYAEERGERLAERADRSATKAASAHAKAHAIAEAIPMGQPILVGHHSERRHRRDVERIDRQMRTAVEASGKAKRLRDKSERIRQRAEEGDDPGVIARRLDRLRAELRKMQRHPWATHGDEYKRRMAEMEKDIGRNEALLRDAGGAPAAAVKPGDVVKVRGQVVTRIIRGRARRDIAHHVRVRHAAAHRGPDRQHGQHLLHATPPWAARTEGTDRNSHRGST